MVVQGHRYWYPGKLVNSACYDKQHGCAYHDYLLIMMPISRWTSYTRGKITTLWGIKTHQNFFYHNLKKSDPISISCGTNISDTTGHQMTV